MSPYRVAAVLAASLLSVFLAGCPPCPEERKAGPALAVEDAALERRDGDCDSAGNGCATFRVAYPRIARAGSAAAADSLNAAVASFVQNIHGGPRTGASAVEAAEAFLQQYRSARAAAPAGPGWRLDRRVTVVFDSLGIVTLRMEERSFTGGAHGNSTAFLRMFDSRTGRRLTLQHLLLPGYEPTFRRLAEQAFRASRKIPPAQGLAEAGFRFDGRGFALPNNIGAVPAGILLVYNPYEAAPYARGGTECAVPFDSLQRLIRRDGPLSPLAPWPRR